VGSWNEVRKGKRRERRLLSLESQRRFSSRIPVLNEVKLCFKNQRDKLEGVRRELCRRSDRSMKPLDLSLSLLLRFLAEFHFLYILVRLRRPRRIQGDSDRDCSWRKAVVDLLGRDRESGTS
jgi:hypothetical protein